jgi:hypothetical protein
MIGREGEREKRGREGERERGREGEWVKWLLILLQAQPKSRQGWQDVATRLQPVVHGDG